MRLHIHNVSRIESQRILDAMKCVLATTDSELHQDCNCGITIGMYCWYATVPDDWEWTMRNICLYALGHNDYEKINNLRLVGDGKCTNCGSNAISHNGDYYECEQCGEIFLPAKQLVYYNGRNYWN